MYLKVKIDGLPIPKGSLVKGQYTVKPRNVWTFAMYFSTIYCKYTSHRQSIRVYEGIHVNTPSSTSPCHEKIIIRLCPDVSPETVACLWKSNTNATSETRMQEESPVRKSSFLQRSWDIFIFGSFHEHVTRVGPWVAAKQKSVSYTKSVSTGWAGNVLSWSSCDWLECKVPGFSQIGGPVGPR